MISDPLTAIKRSRRREFGALLPEAKPWVLPDDLPFALIKSGEADFVIGHASSARPDQARSGCGRSHRHL